MVHQLRGKKSSFQGNENNQKQAFNADLVFLAASLKGLSVTGSVVLSTSFVI